MILAGFLKAQTSFDVELEKAKELKERGYYDSAALAFESIINTSPDLPKSHYIDALNWWGLSLLNSAQSVKADSVLTHAINLNDPESTSDSLLLADSFFFISKNSGSSGRFRESIDYINRSLDLWERIGGQDSLIACGMNMLGYDYRYFGDYPQALSSYERADSIWTSNPDMTGPEVANTYAGFGWVYTAIGDYLQAIENHQKAFEMRQELFEEDHPYIANSLASLGGVFLRIARYDKAEEYIKRAHEKLKIRLGENHPNVISMYSRLGTIYYQLGDYQKSIQHHKEAIRRWEFNKSETSLYPISFNGELAKSQYANGQKEDALETLNKAFAHAEGFGRTLYLFSLYRLQISIYQELRDHINWLQTLNQAEKLLTSKLNSDHPSISILKAEYGTFYMDKNELDNAKKMFFQALKISNDHHGMKHPEVSDRLFRIGNFYLHQNNWDSSEFYYRASFRALTDQISEYPIADEISNLRQAVVSLERIAFIQASKGRIQTPVGIEGLNNAYETYTKGIEYLEYLRQTYSGEEAKIRVLDVGADLFKGAVEVSAEMYRITGDEIYLYRALEISEKSKAFVLLNAINNHKAQSFAGVPNSLVEYEKQLKTSLSYLKQRIESLKISGDSTLLNSFQEQRFHLLNKKDSLYSLISNDYSQYFEFQHTQQKLNIPAIRKHLGDQSAIIEFFLSNDSIYCFLLSAEDLKLFVEKRSEEIENWLVNYRRSVSDYQWIIQNADESDHNFLSIGNNLYQTLLEKPLSSISANISKLILIPHEELWQINLGILPSTKVRGDRIDYRSYPYLLKSYDCSYAYSTSFLASIQNPTGGRGILAVAPEYDGMNGLSNLTGTIEEVEQISSLFSVSEIISNGKGLKRSFLDKVDQYQIIHLAMHGIIDDKNPLNSRLMFSSLPGDFIALEEIYTLKLNADLVVLSACDSGLGEIQKGEGNQSMSRAFNYAGVPQVTMSLWKVTDATASSLMSDFYENLNSGLNPSEAMGKAQKLYIEEVEDPLFSHPYFWASFVTIGSDQPISNGKGNILYYLLVFGVLMVIIIWERKFR